MSTKPIWAENGKVYIIDQTKLPVISDIAEVNSASEMWDAIKILKVRGAPAIGIAAAFGMFLGIRDTSFTNKSELLSAATSVRDYLNSSRPTAVNLFWATARVVGELENRDFLSREETLTFLFSLAETVLQEDIASCRSIGLYGVELIKDCKGILTHCNAGALATSEYGTALSPIYVAYERGLRPKVYSDETRPLLQGSRITAYELMEGGVDVTTICDNMAGVVMNKGFVDAVIVGSDRIAANGDIANKIGTFSVAVLAHYHRIPFYIAAPFSTVDFSIQSGADIPIEERDKNEVRYFAGCQSAPSGVEVYNPAFDVTPHELITAIITEKGIVTPPFEVNLARIAREGIIR